MGTLTPQSISTELLEDTLLALEHLTNSLTMLAISASRCPEESPRVRLLLDELVTLIHQCEDDLGTYRD